MIAGLPQIYLAFNIWTSSRPTSQRQSSRDKPICKACISKTKLNFIPLNLFLFLTYLFSLSKCTTVKSLLNPLFIQAPMLLCYQIFLCNVSLIPMFHNHWSFINQALITLSLDYNDKVTCLHISSCSQIILQSRLILSSKGFGYVISLLIYKSLLSLKLKMLILTNHLHISESSLWNSPNLFSHILYYFITVIWQPILLA